MKTSSGGIPTVFGGDFAQILPVVRKGTRATIVDQLRQLEIVFYQ